MRKCFSDTMFISDSSKKKVDMYDSLSEEDLVVFLRARHISYKRNIQEIMYEAVEKKEFTLFRKLLNIYTKKYLQTEYVVESALYTLIAFASSHMPIEVRKMTNSFFLTFFFVSVFDNDNVETIRRFHLSGYLFCAYIDEDNKDIFYHIDHSAAFHVFSYLIRNESYTSVSKLLTKRRLCDPLQNIWETFRSQCEGDDIHLMIRRHSMENIKKWITSGHSVNLRNEFGNTPLHEAVRLGYNDIADMLRNAGAIFYSHGDARQKYILTVSKNTYFSRLSHVIKIVLPYLYPDADMIMFFHSVTPTDRLFCCSVYYTKDPLDDICKEFHDRFSRYIFSAKADILSRSFLDIQHSDDTHNCVLTIFKEFNIRSMIPVQFIYEKNLMGIYTVFSKKNMVVHPHGTQICRSVFLHAYDDLLVDCYTWLWNPFLMNDASFHEWLKTILYSASSQDSRIFSRALFILVRITCFFDGNGLLPHKDTIFRIFTTHRQVTIPLTSLSKCILSELDRVSPYIHVHYTTPSFILNNMEFVRSTQWSLPEQKCPHKFLLSRFDMFEIIGSHTIPSDVLPHINEYISGEDLNADLESIVKVRILLGLDVSLRDQIVVGTESAGNPNYRIFLPVSEIKEAIDKVSRETKDVSDYTGAYKKFVSYIHPFLDGNGRTFRMLFTIMLRQKGYSFLVTKGL